MYTPTTIYMHTINALLVWALCEWTVRDALHIVYMYAICIHTTTLIENVVKILLKSC